MDSDAQAVSPNELKIVANILYVASGLLVLAAITVMVMAIFGDAEIGAVGFTGRFTTFSIGFTVAGIGAGCGGLGYLIEKRSGDQ